MRTAICGCGATIITMAPRGQVSRRCDDCRKVHRNATFTASKKRWRLRMGAVPRAPGKKPQPAPKRKLISFAGSKADVDRQL